MSTGATPKTSPVEPLDFGVHKLMDKPRADHDGHIPDPQIFPENSLKFDA